MRLIVGLCFLMLGLPSVFAQKGKTPRSVESYPFSTHYIFGKKYNLSFSKRLLKYPFNQAAQIQLVSFNGSGGPREEEAKIKDDMPQMWMNICVKPFQEKKTLTLTQIERLSDILHNYGYIKAPTLIEDTKCYEPRNGILFLDAKGKVFEFIEICFACNHTAFSSEKMGEEEIEQPRLDLIKKFFTSVGIEYGISKKFDNQMVSN